MITEFAPAKVNLTLHVTGQRDEGYHLLDSLVMFADVGDTLTAELDRPMSLNIDGPEAVGVPADASNSILKAAAHVGQSAAFHLIKTLPTSAGIGGGTADAAAAFRALTRESFDYADLTQAEVSTLIARAKPLGADVPVCIFSRTTQMRGIGDDLSFPTGLPALHAILVNPRIPVPTPDVFAELKSKKNRPMPPLPDRFKSPKALVAWLADQRNDLQEPAVNLFPRIGDTLRAIAQSNGCLMSRMSGSGATCFGIYGSAPLAKAAATDLAKQHPEWWVIHTTLGANSILPIG